MNMIETDVMAGNATLHQTSISSQDLSRFEALSEKNKKARAEKRLMATLRRMEIEQKAALMVEAKEQLEAARRKFETEEPSSVDYPLPPFPVTIEDFFRAERERERLIALEREQKEELCRQVQVKRARELGDDWPRIQAMSQDPRFDHIPKPWPGYKGIEAGSLSGMNLETEPSNER